MAGKGDRKQTIMASTKEIVELEAQELRDGHRDLIHLHREGSFLRAYESQVNIH